MLNGKRILSLVLALIMVCANLPWDAAATELAEATVATEVTQNAEAAQPDETTQPTEATAPAEELKKEEAAVTDVPAATGASYDEYTTQVTLHVPEYQVGDPIPAPEDIQITVDGATLGEVDGFFLMIGYGDEEPGNIFEAKDYELRFRIHAPEDKPFMSLDTDVVCEGHDVNLSGSSLDYTYLYVRVAYEFDVLPQIGEVDISGIPLDIEAGQAGIPALTLAQEGVQIASATWYEIVQYEDDIPATVFTEGKEYYLEIVLKAPDDYRFERYVYAFDAAKEMNIDDVETDYNDYAYLYVRSYYALKPQTGPIDVTITGIAPGEAVENLNVTVTGNVDVTFWCYEYDTGIDVESGYFEDEVHYVVGVHMEPKDGYAIAYDTPINVYYQGESYSVFSTSWYRPDDAYVWCRFDYRSTKIQILRINELPEDIQAGTAVAPESMYVDTTGVTISELCWVDVNNEPVTQLVDGNVYYLRATLTAEDGYVFVADPYIYNTRYEKHSVVISEREIVIHWRYSLEPDTGPINVTFEGVEVGAKIEDVSYNIEGNARIEDCAVRIWIRDEDSFTYEYVTSGVFESGEEYEIVFDLIATEGYRFYSDTEAYLNDERTSLWITNSLTECQISQFVDFRPPAVTGFYIEDLPYDVEPGEAETPAPYVYEGNVRITGTRWVDADKQPVTELEEGREYYLAVTLTPYDGYVFREDDLDFYNTNCEEFTVVSETELVAYWFYSLLPDVGAVEISVTGIEPGKPVSGVTATVDGKAAKNALSVYVYVPANDDWEQLTDGVFEEDTKYRVDIELAANEGYQFTEETELVVNADLISDWGWGCNNDTADVYIVVDFRPPAVEDIRLDGLPLNREIVPGAAHVPEMTVETGEVKLLNARWVDMEYAPVSTLATGKTYFLELTFEAKDGFVFREGFYFDRYDSTGNDEYTIVSEDKLIYYCFYTLVPEVDRIDLTVTGLEIGKPVTELDITINGNAELYGGYGVYIEATNEYATGKFKAGMLYTIEIFFTPAEGYRFGDGTDVYVNGRYHYLYGNDSNGSVGVYFNTNEMIKSSALNIGKVEVGKSISDTAVTAPTGANFVVQNYCWYDLTNGYEEASGKFQKGHKYEVEFVLVPAKGYAFHEDFTVTLSDGKMERSWVEEDGSRCEVTIEYSFMEKITKVELPAMPTSIKKGITLPTNFKVSSSAKYTLAPMWINYTEQESATKADKNGSYVLCFYVYPKSGYEFDEDVAVYIDGKKADLVLGEETMIYVVKTYNIGVTEINRIDLTVPEPVAGEIPGKVTVPGDAKYQIDEVYWYNNSDGDLMGDMTEITIFQNGKYSILSFALLADDGYAFSNDTVFYVNGQKAVDSKYVNFGNVMHCAVGFGKLGEVKPMPAPSADVEIQDGQSTMTWVPNPEATAYEIWRSTSKTGKFTCVDTVVVPVPQVSAAAAGNALKAGIISGQYTASNQAANAGASISWQDTTATPGKTYYYKFKAVNSENADLNSGFSAVFSMAIKCDAPELTVKTDTSGKPVLSWAKVTAAKKYEIWRSVDGADFKKLTTITKTTYTDTKASQGTECVYKVKAVASKSTYNSEFSTEQTCYVICAVPVLTVKVDTATGKPSLSWKKITGAVSYDIYRAVNGGEFSLLTNTDAISYLDEATEADNQYSYYVIAAGKSEVFNSIASDTKTVTVTVGQPKVIGTVNANGKPVITWEAVEDAVEYEIYRSTSATKSYKLVLTTTDLTYTDDSVAAGKTYYYKVTAVGQNSENTSAYVKLTGKCDIPVLSVEAGSTGKPVLTWNKISGAKKYEIWRSVDGGAFKKLTTVTKTTYTDTKATEGAECTYKVKALGSKSAYNGEFSTEHGCYVTCAAPTLTVKVDTATGKPSLSWKKITGAAGYDIYRAVNGGEFSLLTNTDAISYLDEATEADNQYSYYVVTVGKDAVFNSVASETKTVTVTVGQPKLTGTVNVNGKPVITWEAVEDAVEYKIYRSTKSTKSYTLVKTTTDLSYTDESVAAGKTYYYKVTAVGQNSENTSAYVKLTGKCDIPVLSVEAGSTGKPVLTWNKISGAKKYEIWRSVDGAAFKKLTTVTKTTYTDTKAAVGTVCVYKVKALGSKSAYNGEFSQEFGLGIKCATPELTVKLDAATGKPSLSWKKVTGAVKYEITYQLGFLGGREPEIVVFETTATSYTFADASVDMFGWVEVVAVAENEAFNSQPAEAEVEVVPGAPKITGKVGANGKPVITWNDVPSAIIYEVYRSTKSGSGYTLIGEVDCMSEFEVFVPEYEDTTAVKGKTYYYKVVARSWNTTSAQSNIVKVKSK